MTVEEYRMTVEEYRMTVEEYRKAHPNCKYCEHCFDTFFGIADCLAKRKYVPIDSAKKCELYEPVKE